MVSGQENARAADQGWEAVISRIASGNSRLRQILDRQIPDHFVSRRASGRRKILEAVESERARIARELHAGAGQPLAGIRLNLDLLDQWTGSLPEPQREVISRLHRLSDQALSQIRSVSHRLHPPDWQNMSLPDALRALIDESGIEAAMPETRIQIPNDFPDPGFEARVAIYRCAQEAISNVLRHSGATGILVELRHNDREVELVVRDNGKGIGLSGGNSDKSHGLGLHAIRTHAADADGTCEIDSGSWGTLVHVRVPCSED
jgi:two-component system sensor histidine kinase UhpB